MTHVSDQDPARRYETLDVRRTGAAVTIALNRPERMNAWSNALSADLLAALREAADDDAVRAVMLTGTGKAFCSGADLREGRRRPWPTADGSTPSRPSPAGTTRSSPP